MGKKSSCRAYILFCILLFKTNNTTHVEDDSFSLLPLKQRQRLSNVTIFKRNTMQDCGFLFVNTLVSKSESKSRPQILSRLALSLAVLVFSLHCLYWIAVAFGGAPGCHLLIKPDLTWALWGYMNINVPNRENKRIMKKSRQRAESVQQNTPPHTQYVHMLSRASVIYLD